MQKQIPHNTFSTKHQLLLGRGVDQESNLRIKLRNIYERYEEDWGARLNGIEEDPRAG